MESLPDELILLIFCYLHKFDVFYSFHNLNRHIQQIIEPYQSNIDLTEETGLSYKYFIVFVKNILPICGRSIRSLSLNGYHQLQLFRPCFRQLINLESLTIKSDTNTIHSLYAPELEHFLSNALSLSSLSELSIFDSASETMLKTISTFASKNLTALTLLSQNGFPNFQRVSQMPYIKRLSIDLLSIARLVKVFEIMPNVEELKLSMVFVRNLERIDDLKVPKTLQKLHLEFGNDRKYGTQLNLDVIKKLLNVFKNEVRSLTLIIINAVEEFSNFDDFQSLINNFINLQKFEYYIRTNYQPNSPLFPNVQQLFGSSYCFYTLPQPQFFDRISSRVILNCTVDSNLTLQELIDCTILQFSSITLYHNLPQSKDNIKLVNLKELHIDTLIEYIEDDVCQLFSKFINASRNLNRLTINSVDTEKMIQKLKKLIPVLPYPNNITILIYLRNGTKNFHPTLFYDLSKIFSNLKTLVFMYDISVVEENSTMLTTNVIQELRKWFPRLIRLRTDMRNHFFIHYPKKYFNKYQRFVYFTG